MDPGPEGWAAASIHHLYQQLRRVDTLIVGVFGRLEGELALRGQVGIRREEILELLPRLGHRASPPPELVPSRGPGGPPVTLPPAFNSPPFRLFRLAQLAQVYGLSEVEVDLLLIVLAPELDLRYQRIYAYLQDDLSLRRPTVDMVVQLLAPSLDERRRLLDLLTPHRPLLHFGLVEVLPDALDAHVPFLARPLRVAPMVVDHLQHRDGLPPLLDGLVEDAPELPPAQVALCLGSTLMARLDQLVGESSPPPQRAVKRGPLPLLYVYGPRGGGGEEVAHHLGRRLGRRVLVVEGQHLADLAPSVLANYLQVLFGYAQLGAALILWEQFEALLAPERRAQLRVFCSSLKGWNPWVVCSSDIPWQPPPRLVPGRLVPIRLLRPPSHQQARIWSEQLQGSSDMDIEAITSAYHLTPGLIRDAAVHAAQLAWWRDPDLPHITPSDVMAACRRCSAPALGHLAQHLPTDRSWSNLVVAGPTLARLKELCLQVQLRPRVLEVWGLGAGSSRGIRALFTGPPGTGKTLAASVIARELGVEIYRIDLSSVVSKYIGETEKQLGRVFDEAEFSSAVLFFDEADALFAKRTEVKDAHDRYANLGTSYLLQRMEVYEGVVILASNLRSNMDPAFVRRMSFIVPFDEPSPAERLALWQGMWPRGVPTDGRVDLGVLARRFELTGGMIHNVVLAAAYLAAAADTPLTLGQVLHAIRRELEKVGRMVDERVFAELGG